MNKKLYKLMNWPEIESIVYSENDQPHTLLGVHGVTGGILIQTFQPGAKKVTLIDLSSKKEYEMEIADESGYFAYFLPQKTLKNYSYLVKNQDDSVIEVIDPYQFGPTLNKKETEKFNAGIHYSIYNYLGAHVTTINGITGVSFSVWAPNAQRVSVVSDFNQWDGRIHQMRRLWTSGIFEIFIPNISAGTIYKYEIKAKGGLTYMKSDPYAFCQQLRPENASVVSESLSFSWEDEAWINNRKSKEILEQPINIFELHLGSFKKPEDDRQFYTYKELAPMVIKYVNEMNYTHIELMPIMEHPLDVSWGYQIIGYYAPTSRYGSPDDFMFFMNEMHKAGIGVILDWVPAHFPRDTYGLSNFDGTCLYEHQDPKQGFHPHWGTLIFNYGRPEVKNYLIANALYWITQFHVDGIRMDAVASMLYLDYGKEDGQWIANIFGGNENLEAIEFIKHLNSIIKKYGNGAFTIAEESTAFPRVTEKLENDGLGFDFKWNMGWMNDFLGYIKYDPYFRSHHHNELTFSMIYNYCEKFMLIFSHDEVVHGKSSMIGKMPGEIPDKFKNLRIAYGYMMMHPGKKLLFMGQDIAEFDEWSEQREVHWDLLEVAENKQLNDYVKALNSFYKNHPALYELDMQADGFQWINNISADENILLFLRNGKQEKDTLLVVANFANATRLNYKIGVPLPGNYREVLNSDASEFGGTGVINKRLKQSKDEECDTRANSITINMAPLSIHVFAYLPYSKKQLEDIALKKKDKEQKAKQAEKQREISAKEKAKIKASLKEELAKKIAKAEEQIAAGSELEVETELKKSAVKSPQKKRVSRKK